MKGNREIVDIWIGNLDWWLTSWEINVNNFFYSFEFELNLMFFPWLTGRQNVYPVETSFEKEKCNDSEL